MIITPDEMLDILERAYEISRADYDAAIAQGVPGWLLAKPEPPTMRHVMVAYNRVPKPRSKKVRKWETGRW